MANRALTVIAIFCVTLSLTAQTQTPPSAGRVIGHLTDATGTPVRGATVILSTPEGQTVGITIATVTGDYAFPAAPPGDYVVQVFAVGFGPSRLTNVKLKGDRDLQQDVAMDIGFVRNAPAAGARGTVAAGNTEVSAARVRIGGNVAERNLIQKTEPVYPAQARNGRIQGVVILEAVIGIDGSVSELKVINGHPTLVQTAIDTVKTWRYRPNIVNGVATEVVTTVTVNFQARQ